MQVNQNTLNCKFCKTILFDLVFGISSLTKNYLQGNAINSFELNGTTFPLIYGGDAINVSAGSNKEISSACVPGSLNSYKVEGKIVVCDTIWDGSGVLMADGLGAVMSSNRFSDLAFSYPLPATLLNPEDGAKVADYAQTEA